MCKWSTPRNKRGEKTQRLTHKCYLPIKEIIISDFLIFNWPAPKITGSRLTAVGDFNVKGSKSSLNGIPLKPTHTKVFVKKTPAWISEVEFSGSYAVHLGFNDFGVFNDWDVRSLALPCLESQPKSNLTICFIFVLGLKPFSWSPSFHFSRGVFLV